MKKNFLLILLFVQTVVLFAQNDTTQYGVVIPKGFTYQIDVEYDKVGGWIGKLDIYMPPNTGTPTPIVLNIHGGGWNHGSKEKQTGFGSFFKNNMAVANMSYRLVDVAPAPAAIEDVRSVLAYLVRHAKELNIDTSKIVIQGGSAGGHLAMMGAYLGNNTLFDKGRTELKNFKAAAVIDKYGIVDMVNFSTGYKPYKSAVRWIGAHIDDVDFIKSVSPLYHIDKNTPSTFIVHGDADPIVPYKQSVALKEKLDEYNIANVFITVEGGGHGKFEKTKQSEISREIINFLKKLAIIN